MRREGDEETQGERGRRIDFGNETYHLRGLWASDVELLVGILLPVTKEKRKLEEKTVVCISEGGDRLGARVSV